MILHKTQLAHKNDRHFVIGVTTDQDSKISSYSVQTKHLKSQRCIGVERVQWKSQIEIQYSLK